MKSFTLVDQFSLLLSKMTSQEKIVEQYASLASDEYQASDFERLSREGAERLHRLRNIIQDLHLPVARNVIQIDSKVSFIYHYMDVRKRQDFLESLSRQPYTEHHATSRHGVLSDTGEWFLQSDVFQSWCKSTASSILWLHGIPGSGKSKLV